MKDVTQRRRELRNSYHYNNTLVKARHRSHAALSQPAAARFSFLSPGHEASTQEHTMRSPRGTIGSYNDIPMNVKNF